MKKNIIAAVVLLAVLGIGILIGTKLNNSAPIGAKDTFQDGWNAAKNKLVQAGLILPENAEIKSMTGTIKSISGNKIVIATDFDPLADSKLLERTIVVTDGTKINQLTMRDAGEIRKEAEEFAAKINEENGSSITAPEINEKKQVTVAELKTGDFITVFADENIRTKKEFSATEINVTPKLLDNSQAPNPPVSSDTQSGAVQTPANLPTPPANTQTEEVLPAEVPAPPKTDQ